MRFPRRLTLCVIAVTVPFGLAVPLAAQTTLITRPMPTHVVASSPEISVTTVRGTTIDAQSRLLPNSNVRLRNVRTGRVVGTQVTDQAGLFNFKSVDPGSYVVELLDSNQTVAAASDILYVNAGNTVSTLVQIPLKTPPIAGLISRNLTTAAVIAASATATGVLAVQVSECASPPCNDSK